MALWLAEQPLILASKSASRRALLEGAGLPLEIVPADVDERTIEAGARNAQPADVAALLAREKALAVSRQKPGRLVVGADQTLALQQRTFNKPPDVPAAREQLKLLRGETHALHSAVALALDGALAHAYCETARLTMREFSDRFLEDYLGAAGLAVTASVGAYQVEALGIHLFERIEGDHSTILGLPLIPLLAFLRRTGCLSA